MNQTWTPRKIAEIPTERLLAVGLRSTQTRARLIDLFDQYQMHQSLTCEEVYRLLHGAGFDIGLSSIYTNVRHFVRAGVLVRRMPRDKAKSCETFFLSRL